MRRVRIFENISLDGVIQAPGGRKEDPDNGFAHGGWSAPFSLPEGGESIVAAQGTGYDLLLGRRTYDIWSAYWPAAGRGPIADGFNAATKYVATHRPGSLEWGPANPIGPDLASDIRRLRSADGPDLIVWGSSSLTSVLLEHELADEIMLIVYPVLLGVGKRLFAEGTPPVTLKLKSSSPAASGVIINKYAPAGPLRTGEADEGRQ